MDTMSFEEAVAIVSKEMGISEDEARHALLEAIQSGELVPLDPLAPCA